MVEPLLFQFPTLAEALPVSKRSELKNIALRNKTEMKP
jgi:hypothetical protein